MNGKLQILPITGTATIASVRLIHAGITKLVILEKPHQSDSTVRVSALDGAAKPETLSDLTFGSTVWDAAGTADGSISIVAAIPESGRVWLSYLSTKPGSSTMVNGHHRSGYFGAPHFIKGAQKELAITSAAYVKGVHVAVVFTRQADGDYGEFRELPVPDKGELMDALLVRFGAGYLLFSKFLARGGTPRHPGILYVSELDSDFHEIRSAKPCLDGRDIFDFDADASGGRVVLFAVTENGYNLASGPDFSWRETPAGQLSSPSVLFDGDLLHFAAIESAGTAEAKIMVGSVRETP